MVAAAPKVIDNSQEREAGLQFRQIYDTDQFITHLLQVPDCLFVLAELIKSRTSGMSRDDYFSLFPDRKNNEQNLPADIGFHEGQLRLILPAGDRVISYAFAEAPRMIYNQRSAVAFKGGEWDSGYYPCYGNFVKPVTIVILLNANLLRQQILETVPPTYVLPFEWSADIKAFIDKMPKAYVAAERSSYFMKILNDNADIAPIIRLAAIRFLAKNNSKSFFDTVASDLVHADTVFTGALTYQILRYGTEEEREAYVDCVAALLSKGQPLNLRGLVLGSASVYTKFTRPEVRMMAIREQLRVIDSTPGNVDKERFILRAKLLRELTELSMVDPIPPALTRFLNMLIPRVDPADKGLHYILWRIVDKNGPQAKYLDRSDRIPLLNVLGDASTTPPAA